MKSRIIIICSVFIAQFTFGQTSTDYLRYSKNYFGGSARSLGMGGAFGAVGADISNMSTNPAGLGLYKKSDILFSPSLFFASTESDYQGVSMHDSKSNFNLGSYGAVFTTKTNSTNWNYFQFGIGVNRINNFNNRVFIQGSNNTTSLISDYQDQAYNTMPDDLDPFSTNLAWFTYLLADTVRVAGNNLAYTSYLNEGGTLQQKDIRTWGSTNEMSLSFSGSFQDKFYIGASIGFPFVRYFENSTYTETDDADTIPTFQSFELFQELSTRGTGVNFKFGVLARPVGWARFGFAFHTPTYLNLTDEYYTSITAYSDSDPTATYSSPNGIFDYKVVTPMKFMGNLAFTLKKMMIISAEIEYLDYSEGEIRSNTANFGSVNNDIRNGYTSALNIRSGLEFNFEPMLFRLGAGWYGSPYAKDLNDGSALNASAGIGFRQEGYYLDLAYVYSRMLEDYYLYNSAIVPAASILSKQNSIVMTLGAKF